MKADKQLRRITMAIRVITLATICMATSAYAAEGTQQAASPVYAPVKEKICTDCKISVPAEMIPRRGVVVSIGGFFTPTAYWEMVDIDQRKMTRFITQINTDTHKLAIVQSRVVSLSESDVAEVIELTNLIWRFPGKLSATSPTHGTWGVDLFDGDIVRKEFGIGEIPGDGANLSAALEQIWQRLAR